jgi:hemerythrin-like domain-containing protein
MLRRKFKQEDVFMDLARRDWLVGLSSVGAGVILLGCNRATNSELNEAGSEKQEEKEKEVTATEDLMREHGVLRRALLIYHETVLKLRSNSGVVQPQPLQKTAKLFRAFGEDYHEKKLEEAYIFPAVKKAGGAAGAYADVLTAQHLRGREITDYIISATAGPKLAAANVESFAGTLESLVRMYEHHAAIEDTIVFPAWKETLSAEELDEMNDKFEEIEHEQFGADGFENAVKQISDIEAALGFADLGQFTAQPPPETNAPRDKTDSEKDQNK